jgi:hypothetical protein
MPTGAPLLTSSSDSPSRTDPEPSPQTAISSSSSHAALLQHLLLNSWLLGVKLKAAVSSRHFKDKEVIVSLELVARQPSIQHASYKTLEYLTPEWISPKHPHLTHDNACLS